MNLWHCSICGTVEWDMIVKLDNINWICDTVEYLGLLTVPDIQQCQKFSIILSEFLSDISLNMWDMLNRDHEW